MSDHNRIIKEKISTEEFKKLSSLSKVSLSTISSIRKQVNFMLSSETGGTPQDGSEMKFTASNKATAYLIGLLVIEHLINTVWDPDIEIKFDESNENYCIFVKFNFD